MWPQFNRLLGLAALRNLIGSFQKVVLGAWGRDLRQGCFLVGLSIGLSCLLVDCSYNDSICSRMQFIDKGSPDRRHTRSHYDPSDLGRQYCGLELRAQRPQKVEPQFWSPTLLWCRLWNPKVDLPLVGNLYLHLYESHS